MKTVKNYREEILAGYHKIAIISPTEEWDGFGVQNNLTVIRLHDSDKIINFFACFSSVNIERFYENLAMLLASASGAGPYTSSLEKCLLSAFREVYLTERKPDPVELYEKIEDAIIEQHAKRTHSGAKYTKHGENIKAALENLRLMLFKPQFAYSDGIDFGHLLEDGVVFDLSQVSNSMKPLFYALILNQIYSFADTLDIDGDNSIRIIICVEEAQHVFDKSDESATNQDLKQRIQDFRKKGVALMLITHNVTDINSSVRRLCQTKMYFRQSAEIAKYGTADLIFNENEAMSVTNRLKTLEQRYCAVNYITLMNGNKIPAESLFVKVPEHFINSRYLANKMIKRRDPDTKIILVDQNSNPLLRKLELFYLRKKVHKADTNSDGLAVVSNLLKDKLYGLRVLEGKAKDTKIFSIIAGQTNIIKI